LLASVAYAAPQFPSVGSQGITAEQRAIYLPAMRALLKVMEDGSRLNAQDINTLFLATRELNKRVPKGQNLLGNFGETGGFGGFDIVGLENMGLPQTGDIVINVDGVPHVKTTFGAFPLSETSLMTAAERAQFLPIVRTFTGILEKGNASPSETNKLLGQIRELNQLIPAHMRANIEQITGLASGNFGNFGGLNTGAFSPPRSSSQSFGGNSIPTPGISADQRATYLPVMRALLKVMEANIPNPEDINTLLKATRELNKKVPKEGNLLGGLSNFGNLGGFGQAAGQFGIDDDTLQNMGLPETGEIVIRVDGVPHIRTSFGVFPLTSTSLMTQQERQQFLPIVRSFTAILEKGSANADEANALLAQATQLSSLLPANFRSSIQALTTGFSSGRIGDIDFSNLGSFPSQGITSEQRAIYLPVMKALLKVMSTKRPAAQDINNLLIVTRELNKKVPKGQNLLGNFGSGDLNFGVDDLESMGLPETGDLIITVKGTPHIKTTFGVFPLSETSLMTDQERQQFLPVVKTFTKVLEKGSADATDTKKLVQQIRELNKLIPANIGKTIEGLIDNITV